VSKRHRRLSLAVIFALILRCLVEAGVCRGGTSCMLPLVTFCQPLVTPAVLPGLGHFPIVVPPPAKLVPTHTLSTSNLRPFTRHDSSTGSRCIPLTASFCLLLLLLLLSTADQHQRSPIPPFPPYPVPTKLAPTQPVVARVRLQRSAERRAASPTR